jgi:uncharacterized protein (DUF1778 family)
MATNKPRITITLEPEQYELVRELARMNDQSMSSVVVELVQAIQPTIERVVNAGRAFEQLSDDMKDKIRANFEGAEQRIMPALTELEADFLATLASVSEAAAAPEDPRAVTRGSRPPHPPTHLDDQEPRS